MTKAEQLEAAYKLASNVAGQLMLAITARRITKDHVEFLQGQLKESYDLLEKFKCT